MAPYLEYQIRKLGVKVVLGEEVTPLLVDEIKPNVLFIATGSVPTIPEILGVQRDQVVTAHDLLAGRASVKERVVVIGGGMVGAETAEFLAEEGKRVTILEMLRRIGMDMVPMAIQMLYQRLKKLGVAMITNARVQEITEHGVVYEKDGEKRTVETDSVVLAAGSKPNITLIKALEGKVAKIYAIGDAKETGNVLEAIHEASKMAREI